MSRTSVLPVVGLLSFCWLVCGQAPQQGLAGTSRGTQAAWSATPDIQESDKQRPPAQFENKPRLRVEEITDEIEADRREAMTLFAIGRLKANEGENAEAARMLQRAHRLDPQSSAILQQILPVEFQMDRPAEAVRYALKAVDSAQNPNPLLVQFMADYFAQQGEFDQAIALYERVDELATEEEKHAPEYVRMRFVMGRLYHSAKKYAEAVEAFQTVLAARAAPADFSMTEGELATVLGDQTRTLPLIAESFLEAGNIDQAELLFAEATTLAKAQATPETMPQAEAAERLQNARIAAARGERDMAMGLIHETLLNNTTPARRDELDFLQELLADTDQSDQLIPQLMELQTAQPDNAQLALKLAELLRTAERPDDAAAVLTKLHDSLDATDDATRLSRMSALAALVDLYAVQRNAEQLYSAWSQLKELTEDPEAFAQAGSVAMADNVEFAKDLLAVADATADSKVLTYGEAITAATIAMQAQEHDRAEAYFNQAIKAKPKRKADILLFWGMNLLVADENAKAAAVFQRGISERALPFGQPDFYYHLAGAQTMVGDYRNALNSARRAAAMAADNPRILARVAWVQYRAGNEPVATEAYELLVRRFDGEHDSAETRDAVRQARLVLSSLATDRGDMPVAEEWLEQVLDEFPDDEGALNDLGYLWADQNKHLHRAYTMIRRAVDTEPDNAAYLDSLGWVLHRLGRHDEAVGHLQRSVELRQEPDGVVLDHLGDAYLAAENVNSAREAWQKAIQAFDPQQEADKIQAVAAKLANSSSQD